MSHTRPLQELEALLRPLVGQRPWGVAVGHGSFLTLELGERQPPSRPGGTSHGAWHLWIREAAWRVEVEGEILGGSGDERAVMSTAAGQLEGQEIRGVEVALPGPDLCIDLAGDYRLRVFAMIGPEGEHWELFMPDGHVVVAGPGSAWSIVRAAG